MRLFDSLFGPPTKSKFASLVIEGIRRAGESRELVFDEEQFRLHPAGDPWPIMNLVNVYEEFCAAQGTSREHVVRVAVRNWFADRKELPESFEDVHPDLLPSVRSRSYSEFTRLQLEIAGAQNANWPQHVMGEHLAVGLVYDLPDSMRHIQQRDLDEWGVSYYEALEAARENLLQLPGKVFASPDQGIYISNSGDNYDASRLILLDLIRQFGVRGDHVAMVPNRDTLLVTGSEDEAGLEVLVTLAEKTLKQPRPITGFAFRLEDNDWTSWLPPEGHPQFGRFHRLHVQSLGQDYAEQRALLAELHQRQGRDVFLATYNVVQERETGRLSSYSLWAEGVETLLPRTELIIFFRPNGSEDGGEVAAKVQWERVCDVAGDLLEPTNEYPQRYHVRAFPSAAQLASLGHHS